MSNNYDIKELREKIDRCKNMDLKDVSLDDVDDISPIKIDRSGHITSYGSAVSIGDMFKNIYDTNNNNIVDRAEHLDNGTNQLFFDIS